MKVTIHESKANGVVIAPPSKSYAHRLILLAFIQNQKCIVRNVSLSLDIKATLDCIKALGGSFNIIDDKVIFDGNNKRVNGDIVLECNESGSTLRFIIPIALSLYPNRWIRVRGSKKLMSRGLSVYEDIFKSEGIEYEKKMDTFSFMGELKSNYYKVLGSISSQFITGLIFAFLIMGGKRRIEIVKPVYSKSYIVLTIHCLKKFNANVSFNDCLIDLDDSRLCNDDVSIEGDYSLASFFEALNFIDEDNKVIVRGLNENSLQGDKIYFNYFKLLKEGTPTIDIGDCIDLGPILFVLGSVFKGARIINTSRLKYKESDRISELVTELEKFGCEFEILDNEVIVHKAKLHQTLVELDGHNDHRIVMALTVLLTKFGGIINGCECIDKSFPDFFEVIKKLGVELEFN